MLAPTSLNTDGLALAEASTALNSPATMLNTIKGGGIQNMLLPLPDNLEHPEFVDELLMMLPHHVAIGSSDNPVLKVDSPLPETTARAGPPLPTSFLDPSAEQVIELPKGLGIPPVGAEAATANKPVTIPTDPIASLQPVAPHQSREIPSSGIPHVMDTHVANTPMVDTHVVDANVVDTNVVDTHLAVKTHAAPSPTQPAEQTSPGPLTAEVGETAELSDEGFASTRAAPRSSVKGDAHQAIAAIPPDPIQRTPTESPVTIPGREGLAGDDLSTAPPTIATTQVNAAATQSAAAGAIKSTTPVEPTAILSEVAEHVVSARQSMENGHARLEITLDPPELGRITVELREVDDYLAAKLIVTEAATLETIKQSMSSMMDSLSEAGIDLDDFQLESFLQHEQSDGETDSEQFDTRLQQEPIEEADSTNTTRVRGVNILA